MDLPPEEEEGDLPSQLVRHAHHHGLDEQLIFSEEQLAESLGDPHHHHHHHQDHETDLEEGTLIVQALPHQLEVDAIQLEDDDLEDHHHQVVGDDSLMETTDDGEGQILETIVEEGEEGELHDHEGHILVVQQGDLPLHEEEGQGQEEEGQQGMSLEGQEELVHEGQEQQQADLPLAQEEMEEEEVEPPCQCPTCVESSDENGMFKGLDPNKAKCVICYATIPVPEVLRRLCEKKLEEARRAEEEARQAEEAEAQAQAQAESAEQQEQHGQEGLAVDAETQQVLVDEHGVVVAVSQGHQGQEELGLEVQGDNVLGMEVDQDLHQAQTQEIIVGIKSEAREHHDALERDEHHEEEFHQDQVSYEQTEAGGEKEGLNLSEDTANRIKEALSKLSDDGESVVEDSILKLDLIFQVLSCSFDDLDQDVDLLLNYVPICEHCTGSLNDAVAIYKEIQKLEQALGGMRESIKEQVSRSFDVNFCKRKKDDQEIEGLVGQIDATRRAILGEDCPAIARLLNYKKKGRRGRKPGRKKKAVVNKSALYPQVTLEPGSKKRGRPKKKNGEYDSGGVKQEYASDPDYDEFDDEEEEHEVIQTHSGRRVKKPNYKKWLLADEDDEEGVQEDPIKTEKIDEGAVSPRSEPDWSPGHSDDEFQEGAESETTSEDSDLGNSDEENEFEDDEDDDDLDKSPSRKRRRSSANRIPCPECTRTFADEEKKELHFKRYHEPGGEKYRKKGSGAVHIVHCEHCDKEFKRSNLLRKHLEKDHGISPENIESGDKKKHVCEFCGQKYRNGSELRVHVRLHTGETPFKCDHCDQSFVSALKRETHIEQCHWEVPPLKCEFCDRAFFRQHRLRIHRITHTGERAYLCEICSQAFSHPTYLKYHQGQHAELNMESYKCKECGKQFANPTNLKLHVKTVHLKEFRFSCEVCGMGFTHMSHKRIHMRGHTGERPYKCEICGESFRYKDRLRIHLRGHTGERPFVCEVCKKGFASRSKLKRHEKIHEKSMGNRSQDEEPQRPLRYNCDDCKKAFAEPQHLSAHKRYCQKKNFAEKDDRPKATKSAPGKAKVVVTAPAPIVTTVMTPVSVQPAAAATTVQKIQIEHIPTHAIQGQPTQMLVPVTYTYPVAYGYEVAPQYHQQPQQEEPTQQQQQTTTVNVREYQSYS